VYSVDDTADLFSKSSFGGDNNNDDDNVADVAHPQTVVNVASQRHYVDGRPIVTISLLVNYQLHTLSLVFFIFRLIHCTRLYYTANKVFFDVTSHLSSIQ